MKLIDADAAVDALKELTANGTNRGMVFGEDAVHRIEMLPSVQSEIIRCKDCLIHGVCRFEQGLGLNGYCSQAKGRTNG